jgi:hypothetical protein
LLYILIKKQDLILLFLIGKEKISPFELFHGETGGDYKVTKD